MPYIGNQHNVGDHVNNFKVLDDISSYTATFDGSATSVVSTSAETIRIPEHRFIHGQRVTYNNGGGSNIGGLTSGTAYYISFDSANTVKLATSLANANSNTVINLSSVGGGTSHTLNAAFDGVNTKFKLTFGSGNPARLNNATQINVAINNVIQRPNLDANNFTDGFALADNHKIVFKTAPTSQDIFWGSIIANTIENFDLRDNEVDNFTGNGTTTEFTLSTIPANNESVIVTIDGVLQHPSDKNVSRAYALLANVIQFTSAPALDAEIQVRHIGFAGATTNDVSGFYGRTGNVTLTANDHITTGDITSRNINASGIITAASANFGGNVTIGGTLTYEDVSNIDSVGIITARQGIFIDDSITHIGDTNTKIRFPGNDQISFETGGVQRMIVGVGGDITIEDTIKHSGDTNTKIRFPANDTFTVETAGSERIRFTSDGRIGINDNTPNDYELDILKRSGVTDANIRLYNNDTTSTSDTIMRYQIGGTTANNYIYFGDSADVNAGQIRYSHSNNFLSIHTNAAERVRITDEGRVGLGTNSPGNELDIWSANPAIRLTDTDPFVAGAYGQIGQSGSVLQILADSGNTSGHGGVYFYSYNDNDSFNTYRIADNYHIWYNSGEEKMRLIGGKLGIGTNSPLRPLHIEDADCRIRLTDVGYATDVELSNVSGDAVLTTNGASNLRLQTNNTERFRIDSAGRVGLGIANPDAYFSSYNRVVMGRTNDSGSMTIVSAPTYGGYIAFADGTSGNEAYRGLITYAHGQDAMIFNTAATERLRITNSGNIGIGTDNVQTLLHLKGTGGGSSGIRFDNSHDYVSAYFKDDNNDSDFLITYVGTGGSELTIHADGNLGLNESNNGNVYIGTNASLDNARLTIAKSAVGFTTAIALHNSTSGGIGSKIISTRALVLGADYENNSGDNSSYMAFETNASEKVRITSAGAVGINTTNPENHLLEIYTAASADWKFRVHTNVSDGAGFYQRANGDFEMVLRDASNNNNYIAGTSGALQFATSGTEKLRIDSNGQVGINTDISFGATNNVKLVVNGDMALRTSFKGDNSVVQMGVYGKAVTMTTSALDVLRFNAFGNGAVEITVFRRDTTNPQGAQITKLYIAFGGSGNNITSASLVQEDKVTRGSIHNFTYTISENNTYATLTATGNNNGGEAQSLDFHCISSGGNSRTITVL